MKRSDYFSLLVLLVVYFAGECLTNGVPLVRDEPPRFRDWNTAGRERSKDFKVSLIEYGFPDFVDYDDDEAELLDENEDDEEYEEGGRIIGGLEAAKGQFPFVIGLWRTTGVRPFCGGSLITSQ